MKKLKNLVALFVLLFAANLASSEQLPAEDVDRFWRSVTPVVEGLSTEAPMEDLAQSLNEISAELATLTPDFALEIRSDLGENGALIVSAEGIELVFPIVSQIVESAPEFPNIDAIAFRQPRSDLATFELQVDGIATMRARDVGFLPFGYSAHDQTIAIVLVHDLFSGPRREQAVQAGFLLLDASIGEVRVTEELGQIDFVSPQEFEQLGGHQIDLLPLSALGAELERVRSEMEKTEPPLRMEKTMTDDEKIAAWNALVLNADETYRDGTGERRAAAIAAVYMGGANRGGINSFLTDSPDLAAQDVLDALETLGATVAAGQLRTILDELGDPLPAATPEERWDQLETLWTDNLDVFDVLTEAADKDLLAALERHVERNLDYYLIRTTDSATP
ncbi:DMP19 family protein [Salipiger bermudensis]|uniref:DMP19 family protein n=1 Tax=Salipiger bermudensis TaxID=344736 RepID=UPI001CD66A49|nr:DMP19 family protein [Salipiger bermudensis]MCA0964901.1 DMP19 family protein [Salipiger bermudensis]